MAKRRSPQKKSLPEAPTCNCVLLCDEVTQSAKGKHSLHGVIGIIAAPTIPAWIGGYVTYVRISNVYGLQTVRISLDRADDGVEVMAFDVQLNPPDPLGVHTIVAVLPPFKVDQPGRYLFEAKSGQLALASSPIQIVQARQPGEEDE